MIKLFPWNLWFIPLMNSLLYTLLIKPLRFPIIEIRSSVINGTCSWTLVYSIQVRPKPKVFLHSTAVSQFRRFDSLGHGSAISSWVSNVHKYSLSVQAEMKELKGLGGRVAQWIAYLLFTQRPRVRFSAFPRFFSEILDVIEIYRQRTA